MNPQFAQPKGSTSKETNKDSIARKFGCKKSEVVYAKAGQSLSGYKVIYDKVSQRAYALPSNIGAVTVTSLVDGILTHSGGTVDLGALAVLREEYVTLVENFTSGFTIRVKNEVVSDGVSLYRWDGALPKTVAPGSTPETTGGVGLGVWVGVGDASLRSDLSSEGEPIVNPSRVGISPSGNIQQNISHVTPEQFGAIGDGSLHLLSETFSTLTDAQIVYPHATSLSQSIDWAAIQSALNSGSHTLDASKGNYVVNSNLTGGNSLNWIGGVGKKIQMVNSSFILLAGSITALPKITGGLNRASRTVTFATAPALSAGDSFVVYNPTDFSWSQHRAYYREGEFFKVFSATGTTVSIYGLPSDNYVASALDVYKLNGIRVVLDNLHVEGEDTLDSAPIIIRFGLDVVVNNFTGKKSNNYQIEFDRCFGVNVNTGSVINNSPGSDEEYGVVISNCTDVVVNGGSHYANRHCIAIGGRGEVCSIPNRNVKIIGATLRNNSEGIGAADIHGNSDNVEYSNCELSSANMAGRNVRYKNCRIFQRLLADGLCIYGSEIVGGVYEVSNCTLITQGNLDAFGAIALQAAKPMKEKFSLIIRNLTVTGGNGGSNAKLVHIFSAVGETLPMDVDIRGVRNELTASIAVLYARHTTSAATTFISNGFIVDDVYGPQNMYLVYPSGAGISSVPTREMAQTGSVTITSAANAFNTASVTTSFRYGYSKKPKCSFGVSSPTGSAFTNPGQPPVALAYTISGTGIRPAITAASAFTAGTDVNVSWSVGIADI